MRPSDDIDAHRISGVPYEIVILVLRYVACPPPSSPISGSNDSNRVRQALNPVKTLIAFAHLTMDLRREALSIWRGARNHLGEAFLIPDLIQWHFCRDHLGPVYESAATSLEDARSGLENAIAMSRMRRESITGAMQPASKDKYHDAVMRTEPECVYFCLRAHRIRQSSSLETG